MHPFALFAAAGLVLLASWFAAEAFGAWDQTAVYRAGAGGPCPRLRRAQVRGIAFSALVVVAFLGAAAVVASAPAG